MKNCGFRFHAKIAQKDFLSDLMKVITAKVDDFLHSLECQWCTSMIDVCLLCTLEQPPDYSEGTDSRTRPVLGGCL